MTKPVAGAFTEPAWAFLGGADHLGKWDDPASVFLQVEEEGFIGPYGFSVPEQESRRTFRALLGLGIALGAFEVKRRTTLEHRKLSIYVHRRSDQGWRVENRLDLNEEESRAFQGTSLSAAIPPNWLEDMRAVFSSGEKASSVVLASQWLFDSYTGSDQLLNFVQAMVVLEILLGEKAVSDKIGLNELLANRCAYLVSNSHDERSAILRDFREIYNVRSHIVHQGKHRLSMNERVLFGKLHWLCRRVLSREVALLRTDVARGRLAAALRSSAS